MRSLFLCVLGLMCHGPMAAAGPVSVDDLMKVRAISDVRISPGGDRVAYVVSEASLERNTYEGVLYVVSTTGGPPVRMTFATRVFNRPLPSPQLRWSPDGTRLAFAGIAGDRPQVFVIRADGGEARAVTSAPEGVAGFEWAPAGDAIAYVTRDPAPEDEKRRREDNSFYIRVDARDRPTRLWVAPLSEGTAEALTPESQYVERFTWAPSGDRLVYAASSITGFNAQYDTRLYSIARSGGTPMALVDRPGMNGSPQFSPDGRWVAFISTDGRTELRAPRGLAIVDASGGRPRMLTTDGAWIGQFMWAPDSASVFFLNTEGTFARGEQMFDQPIARVLVGGGPPTYLTEGRTTNYAISIDRAGTRLAYRSVESGNVGDVYVRELPSGRTTRLTTVNPELQDLSLGETRIIKWRSFDGMEIWGLLVLPPDRRPDKLPLLVYCHGGPIGGFTHGLFPQFSHTVGQVEPYPVQAMASAGFGVLLPMPRGGSGYGEEGHNMIVDAWGEGDYRDIMAGVDHLIEQGVADPNRLGVMGASYGGFMTSWIVTQTDRFKAASTGASLNDLASMLFLSDAGDVLIEYFKTPWEAPQSYAAHSPLTHADRVKTPLLIQHGELDFRVPVSQAHLFYKALKARSPAIVEFDIYPRGGHVLYEPVMQREQMRRNLEWFTRWLEPARPGS